MNEINNTDALTIAPPTFTSQVKYGAWEFAPKPQNCSFDSENYPGESQVMQCPVCQHSLITGLPHPDFNSLTPIVSEDELTRLSLQPIPTHPLSITSGVGRIEGSTSLV